VAGEPEGHDSRREAAGIEAKDHGHGNGRTDGVLGRGGEEGIEQGEGARRPFPLTPTSAAGRQAEDSLRVHDTDELGQPASPEVLAIRAANVAKIRRMRTRRWDEERLDEDPASWTEMEGVAVEAIQRTSETMHSPSTIASRAANDNRAQTVA
jgi:hypothetical protein